MFFRRESDNKFEITCNRDSKCDYKDDARSFNRAFDKQHKHHASHDKDKGRGRK